MRQVKRPCLPTKVAGYIEKQQLKLDQDRAKGPVDIETRWKARRQTKTVEKALKALQAATGATEPCMYCVDNHGTDIEHFWPKSEYLDRVFSWDNWLLCCTECGRIKGSQFPLDQERQPLLIDPTVEDPWAFMDFDPDTGNLVARFDTTSSGWMIKGEETVRVLQLSSREALANRYKNTYRRLRLAVQGILETPSTPAPEAAKQMVAADEHGQLLTWCLQGAGQLQAPFAQLRSGRPDVWALCLAQLG
jgi:uncharacterized protein (TIGR02646 family)